MKKYLKVKGFCYAFDLEKIKELCFVSSKNKSVETEITVGYTSEDSNALEPTSKVERELKTEGNYQADAIVWEALKMLMDRILDNTGVDGTEDELEFKLDFGTMMAVNTLIRCGVLVDVTAEQIKKYN